jgi:hypothetical protein
VASKSLESSSLAVSLLLSKHPASGARSIKAASVRAVLGFMGNH